jgi:hypothetical protein
VHISPCGLSHGRPQVRIISLRGYREDKRFKFVYCPAGYCGDCIISIVMLPCGLSRGLFGCGNNHRCKNIMVISLMTIREKF